jgi:hypothetical protein
MIKEKFKELLENIIQQTDPENDRVVLTDQYYILVIHYDKQEKVYHLYDILVDDKFYIDYRKRQTKPEYFTELASMHDSHTKFKNIDDVLKYIFN